jgi:hypothetical protein
MFGVGGHETTRVIEMSVEEALLPKFDYHIDESDPDLVVLRRQDGAFVAAFQRPRGDQGGHLGGRKGGLPGVDRGERELLEPSRRGREPKEECLEPREAKLIHGRHL